MKRHLLLIMLIGMVLCSFKSLKAESWPGWRGPQGDGTCVEKNVTKVWDPAKAVWKIKLPGKGHASPIVWENRVFTVTAIPETQERIVLCIDRLNGTILWQEIMVKGPLEKIHQENSYASGTPATDGERIYVAFRVGEKIVVGAHDLVTGKQLWLVRPGTHIGEWGFSNSPVLVGDTVILDGDSKGDSFLIALNRANGETVWRQNRSEKGISYSAPLIREIAGRTQVIQCGNRCVTGFDAETGEEIWTVDGPSQEFVATPVFCEKAGLVFISSSWPMQKILAIRPNGKGNVTETHVAWSSKAGAPYTPSMIVVEPFLLSVERSGQAFCFEAESGEILWQEKLERHHASPVLVDGLVYFINDNGQINVIRPSGEYQQEARYELGESCYASPAISDGQVFIRGFEHLYCFGLNKSR